MSRDWTIAGRFAPPMAQAAMQGANLADPSNPEGNKLLLRATALGLGALSRSPQVASALYGAAEGGARYIDTGRFGSSTLYGITHAAGARVLGRVLEPVAGVVGGLVERSAKRFVSEATEVYGRYIGNPVKALASALFSKAPVKEVLKWGTGGSMETLAGMAETAGVVGLTGYAVNDLQDEYASTASSVNSVPATASAPVRQPVPPPAATIMRMENDETAVTLALEELQAAGGPSNRNAMAAFNDRTSGIFERAVARAYPKMYGGVSYQTAREVADALPDEDVGRTAAENIRKVREHVSSLNPMEWLQKKGDL